MKDRHLKNSKTVAPRPSAGLGLDTRVRAHPLRRLQCELRHTAVSLSLPICEVGSCTACTFPPGPGASGGGPVNTTLTEATPTEDSLRGHTHKDTLTEATPTEDTLRGHSHRGHAHRGHSQRTHSQGHLTEDTLTEDTLTEDTLTENTLTEDTLTENTLTEDTLTRTLSQRPRPQRTLSEDTLTRTPHRGTANI